MKYRSVFDIIGPVMIGPSSSHTAGAARIGLVARNLFGRQPKRAEILFLGSFAKTYKGHGTDIAIIGGVLGLSTYDKRMVNSHQLARELGVEIDMKVSEDIPNHPNTVIIQLMDDHDQMAIQGVSIGGGKIEITELDGYGVRISGDVPTILVWHEDRYGMVSAVTQVLAKHKVNIGYMEVARKTKGSKALMVIETDQSIDKIVCEEIDSLQFVEKVDILNAIS